MLTSTFLLAENIKITNWLSSVWVMSLGIGIGFLLVVLILLKIWFFQKIKFFNSIAEDKTRFLVFGIITSLACLGVFVGFLYFLMGGQWIQETLFEPFKQLFSGGEVKGGVVDPNVGLFAGFAVLISVILGFGMWKLVSHKTAGEFSDLVFDGFLKWLNRICIGMSVFALLGLGLHYVNGFGIIRFMGDPPGFLNSISRLPFVGKFEKDFEIPSDLKEAASEKIEIVLDGSELQRMEFISDQRLQLGASDISKDRELGNFIQIDVGNESEPQVYLQRANGLIPQEPIDSLFVRNMGSDPAKLKIIYWLAPIYDEAAAIPIIAMSVVGIYLGYLIFFTMLPKIGAIALSTFQTEVGQPLFWAMTGILMAFAVLTIFIPYNTFGEDIKMYTDSGITMIRVSAIFLAIWGASKSVAEEIEGRTALTVLSKPVGRRQFLIGKYVGISMAIALLFLFVGLWFYGWVAFKPIYDAKESSKDAEEWYYCFAEASRVIPGLVLCFLEVVIFVAISVAISTRLGILANFLVCFAIYVIGHLTPLLVQSSLGAFEGVAFFGQLVSIVFPVLDHFDVQAAISGGSPVPFSYLGWALVYTGLYSTMAMLVALVLFEDRDLA